MKRFRAVILACSVLCAAADEEIPIPPIRTPMKSHAFTSDDWTALMDFADKHLL